MNPPNSIIVPSFKVRVSDTRKYADGEDVAGIPGSPTPTISAGPGTDVAEWNATYSIVSALFSVKRKQCLGQMWEIPKI